MRRRVRAKKRRKVRVIRGSKIDFVAAGFAGDDLEEVLELRNSCTEYSLAHEGGRIVGQLRVAVVLEAWEAVGRDMEELRDVFERRGKFTRRCDDNLNHNFRQAVDDWRRDKLLRPWDGFEDGDGPVEDLYGDLVERG